MRKIKMKMPGRFLRCCLPLAVAIAFGAPAQGVRAQTEEVGPDEPVPIVIGQIGKKRTKLYQTLIFDVATTDAPNPNARVEADSLPPGATLTNLGNGYAQFQWTPVTGQEGAHYVSFSEAGATKASPQIEVVLVMAAALPLSHGFYRIPYGDGLAIRVSRDHITHTPPVKEDWVSVGFGPLPTQMPIVAAADGRIRSIVDNNGACCDTTNCDNCNNSVWIEHANGEWTKYSHFQIGSVLAQGWQPDDCIQQGELIGYEGDVGFTSGSGSQNRNQTQCPTASTVNATKKCSIHLHWEVRATATNSDLRVPILCNVPGDIAYAGDTITGAPCDPMSCAAALVIPSQVIGDGEIHVTSAGQSISSSAQYLLSTSAAYFAGNRVTLTPGFAAYSGTYFHAMIKPCEGGTTGCPPQ